MTKKACNNVSKSHQLGTWTLTTTKLWVVSISLFDYEERDRGEQANFKMVQRKQAQDRQQDKQINTSNIHAQKMSQDPSNAVRESMYVSSPKKKEINQQVNSKHE